MMFQGIAHVLQQDVRRNDVIRHMEDVIESGAAH